MTSSRIAEGDARERARALVPVLAATAAAHDRAGSFPFDNFGHLAKANLIALRTPAADGGGGGGILEAAHVIGMVAEGEPATALVLAMHYIHHVNMIDNTRLPDALKARLARENVAGVSLINALRVEPDLGSPSRGGLPKATAKRTADGWRLSGHKIYSTGVPILSWYAVLAKTDEERPRVGTFLVPAGLPGTRIVESWDHIGLRASCSHDVVFEDVEIPLDHAADIRPPEEWTAADTVPQHRENGILLAALYNGVAKAARDWTVGFLEARVPANLGKPLATLPRVQEGVGSIDLLLRTNALLIEGLGRNLDEGASAPPLDAHIVKSVVTNNAIDAVQTALSLTGNHGLTKDNPLERHYRDVLCGRVHTPQDDSVRSNLGRLAFA